MRWHFLSANYSFPVSKSEKNIVFFFLNSTSFKKQQQTYIENYDDDFCSLISSPSPPHLHTDKEQYYPLEDVSWWDDNVLILARCSGSVTVSSVRTLRNLLGKSCEWFEPSPRVTPAHDGGFLSLEVRLTMTQGGRSRVAVQTAPTQTTTVIWKRIDQHFYT